MSVNYGEQSVMATCLKYSASPGLQAYTYTYSSCPLQSFLLTLLAPGPLIQLSPAATEVSCPESTKGNHLFRIIILNSALQGYTNSLTGSTVKLTCKVEAEVTTSSSNTHLTYFFLFLRTRTEQKSLKNIISRNLFKNTPK